MKFLHLSDLHLGKRIYEASLMEDQAAVLAQIPKLVQTEQADAVLLAGDLYDRTVPPAEAVELLDSFLTQLSETGVPVFAISGNHDSAGRIAFGARLMQHGGVYLSPVYDGHLMPVTLHDEWGEVDIWMLPFLKPAAVRPFFPDVELNTYNDAVRAAIGAIPLHPARRNVLVAHQFVTGAARCDSEEISVGGLDNVAADAFDAFDYVALGHIHSPQDIGRPTLRYSGSPLAYSFSEIGQQKSATVAELHEKGRFSIRTVPLEPLHSMRRIRGSYMELTSRAFYADSATDDYLLATLTDEQDIPDAAARLRTIYPNLLQLLYDNVRTRAERPAQSDELPEEHTPMHLFADFYEKQNGQPMNDAQRACVEKLLAEIAEEDAECGH